ncbi:MAG: hypothetical protein QNL31_02380 [Flavobacteriaceae bacterium]
MTRKFFHACILFFAAQWAMAQDLNFEFWFNDAPLVLGQTYYVPQFADSVRIEKLAFYISDVVLKDLEKQNATKITDVHLIDLSQQHTLVVERPTLNHEAQLLTFNLGIDSTRQVSGVFSGPLDPTKGMYWTWQSGYINTKLQGTSASSSARNHKFEFHLGGYRMPYNTLQHVALLINKKQPKIMVDLGAFFDTLSINNTNHVMRPGKEALALSQLFALTIKPYDE